MTKRLKSVPKNTSVKQARTDGWENLLTGLGRVNRDKRTGAVPVARLLTEPQMEEIYDSDEMAQKIADKLPYEMIRQGFDIVTNDLKPEQMQDVKNEYDNHDGDNKFSEALSLARIYGGSGIVLGVQANIASAEKPLNLDDISKFEFATVLQRYELWPQVPIVADVTSPNFGFPEFYMLQPRISGGDAKSVNQINKLVHWSRILRFDGAPLSRKGFRGNNYWSASIYQRLYNVLRNYHSAHDSVAVLFQDFAQTIWKIKDLADILSSPDGFDILQRRIAAADLGRSVMNAVVIGEDEEFERKRTPINGVAQVLDKVNNRLVAATDMPHTILLGESPSGLGATGRSEEKAWFDFVKSQQEKRLKKNLMKFLRIIMRSKKGPTGGKEPKSWDIEFRPLFQPTQSEIMEDRKKQAEIDQLYISNGVVSPDDVADSRFGTGTFSFDMTVTQKPSEFDPPDTGEDKKPDAETDVEET